MSEETTPGLDFADVLASSIHDMKNSLGMVLSALEEVVDAETGRCDCTPEKVGELQYEAKRVNDNLIQLLTLYKMERGQYGLNVDEVDVAEFLEEGYLKNKPLLEYKGIGLDMEVDEDLIGYFDHYLLDGVVDNVVTNAARYTRDRLRLTAQEVDGWLLLRVEDNGTGFPPAMLGRGSTLVSEGDFATGRTKLGLHFCALVAGAHHNGERTGYIELSNDSELGGGSFSIYLP